MTRFLKYLLGISIGILIGVGGFTFHYAKGTSYLSNDPKACINCHVMQEHYESWIRSSHKMAATCNDCHIPHKLPFKYIAKMRNGWNHSKAFTLQDWPEPIRITPKNLENLQEFCLHFHATLVRDITDHREMKDNLRCTDCHRSVGHMELS